jgi:uncharacterized protein DUF5615
MRFYLDEDLSDVIAVIGRERFGLDITSAHALGRERVRDSEQLAFAAAERRCIVTRNRRDFIRLTDEFLAESLPHPGVVIVPKRLRGNEFLLIGRGLAELHSQYPEDFVPYLIISLPEIDPNASDQ